MKRNKKKIVIIARVWNPYNHARFNEIVRTNQVELVIFFQIKQSKYRKWQHHKSNNLYRYLFLKGVSLNLSTNTAFEFNINYTVYRELERENPDRIIVIDWDSLTTLLSIIYAKITKTEIILWAGSTKYEKTYLRTISLYYVKLLLHCFDGFISYGTASEEYLRMLGVTKKVEHFYNTIDIDYFVSKGRLSSTERRIEKEKIGMKHDSRVIIFSGRLVKIKCVDLLIKAFILLNKEFTKVELLIVGDGPEKRRLMKIAEENKCIHFLGHQDIEQLPKLYGISDILVLPSISESWGLVVNEAMACGCAIIVSHVCGCSRDLIKDNGIVIEGGNLDSLNNGLRQILFSERRLEWMKERSIEIIDNFRPELLVKKISFFKD